MNSDMHDLWKKIHLSIFSITIENAGTRISSGTGFKIGNYLVTNNHVIQVPGSRSVVRSVLADGHSTSLDLVFDKFQFYRMLVDGDQENGWDYAIIKIEDSSFSALPSLVMEDHDLVLIGSQVGIFGYQFDQPQLSMHVGYVSAQYPKAGVGYIQLDLSVNHGNSGGPLVDVKTGRVIGLVTRKATGLTKQFDELLKAFRQNVVQLQALKKSGMQASIAGLDPVKATLTIQVQMERIAMEISRSANVGIGYAYQISKIRDSFCHLI